MDRDIAYREIHRLIEHYRALPFQDLMAMVDKGVAESEVVAQGESITLSVDIRRASDWSVRINVSAHGNNWWRHESIDESALVERTCPECRSVTRKWTVKCAALACPGRGVRRLTLGGWAAAGRIWASGRAEKRRFPV